MLVNILLFQIIPTKFVTCRTWENPVKRSCKILQEKVLFSCMPERSCKILLQDHARSCEILQESCTKFLQDLAGKQEKGPFLARAFLLGNFEVKFGKWANPNHAIGK